MKWMGMNDRSELHHVEDIEHVQMGIVIESIQWPTMEPSFWARQTTWKRVNVTLSLVAADEHGKRPTDEAIMSVQSISGSVHLVQVLFCGAKHRRNTFQLTAAALCKSISHVPPLPAPTPSSPYFPNLMHHIIHCKIQQSKMDSSSFNRCNAQQPEMDGSFFNCFDDSTLFDLKNIVQFQSGPISSGWSWRKLLIFAHFGWIFVETKGFQWKWIGFSNGCWVFRIVYQPMINVFSFWMDINLVIRIDAESGYLSLNAGHRRKGSWIIEKWVDIDDSCANKRANNLLFGL